MRGIIKRAAVSEAFSEANDSPFKNAKPMEGTLFGTQNAAPMQQSPLMSASLDKQRAELARKHVPICKLGADTAKEWEDGMNDYISHASNILFTSSSVLLHVEGKVNWLKENKGKGESVSHGAEKKLAAEVKNKDVKSVWNNSPFASNSQPGLFSNNQSSNFANLGLSPAVHLV